MTGDPERLLDQDVAVERTRPGAVQEVLVVWNLKDPVFFPPLLLRGAGSIPNSD